MRNGILMSASVLALALGVYCIASRQNRTAAGWICAVCALVMAVALIWLLLFPKYTPIETTGPYSVATMAACFEDENRIEPYKSDGSKRRVSAGFWYPDGDVFGNNTAPLIVFSHGGLGVKESNETLYRELASHGYVVCAIDHTYQSFASKDADGNRTGMNMQYMGETARVDAKKDPKQALELYRKWMTIRTGDINFILDTVIAKSETASDSVYACIDTTKIGVVGHSLGGSAALGVGRMRQDVSAAIALESPYLCDIQGINNAGNGFVFDDTPYPIPVLHIYSDDSYSHLEVWPEYGQNAAMLHNETGMVFNEHIAGVGHFSLTDLSLASPFLTGLFNATKATVGAEQCLRQIHRLSLEFLDSYLKGETV